MYIYICLWSYSYTGTKTVYLILIEWENKIYGISISRKSKQEIFVSVRYKK